MSSRRQRRADASASRRLNRQIAGGALDTCLIPAGASLAGHRHERRFREIIADMHHDPRGIACLCCREPIQTSRPYGALLLAIAAAHPGVGTCSTVCALCWTPDDLSEVEIAATRVLRKIIPNGNFEPLAVDTS